MGNFRSFVGVTVVNGASEEGGDSGKGKFKSLVDGSVGEKLLKWFREPVATTYNFSFPNVAERVVL